MSVMLLNEKAQCMVPPQLPGLRMPEGLVWGVGSSCCSQLICCRWLDRGSNGRHCCGMCTLVGLGRAALSQPEWGWSVQGSGQVLRQVAADELGMSCLLLRGLQNCPDLSQQPPCPGGVCVKEHFSWFGACVRCWRLAHLWDSCKLIVYVLLDLADSLLKLAEAGLQAKRA